MRLLFMIMLLISSKVFAPVLMNDYKAHSILYNEALIKHNKTQEYKRFLYDLGRSESSNDYHRYNKYGYIGRYQFGFAARKLAGFEHITFYDFVNNPSIWPAEHQDYAMSILLEKNITELQDIINQIESGKLVVYAFGKPVTKSGILAGAHLAGYGGVKRYVHKNRNPRDAFGTSLEQYLYKFSGYDF